MKRLALLATAVVLAGCGGGGGSKTTQTEKPVVLPPSPQQAMKALIEKDPALRGTVRTLYQSANWAVVQSSRRDRATAFAFRLVGGHWVPDRSGKVKLQILGPQAGSTTTASPQVALRFATALPSVESALWIDGTELVERGGGSPTRGTIYGAPVHKLQPGEHVAVGYARSRRHGAAVAWVFSVA